jgi:hypothetical protein
MSTGPEISQAVLLLRGPRRLPDTRSADLPGWDLTSSWTPQSDRNHDYAYRLQMIAGGAPEVVRTLPVHVGRLRWALGVRGVRPNPASGPATITVETPEEGTCST